MRRIREFGSLGLCLFLLSVAVPLIAQEAATGPLPAVPGAEAGDQGPELIPLGELVDDADDELDDEKAGELAAPLHNEVDAKQTDEALLKAFFIEMEDLITGSDDRALAINRIKEKLTTEFRKNEGLLQKLSQADADANRHSTESLKLQNRQRVIAQFVIELGTRGTNSNSRDSLRTVHLRMMEFQKAHPQLARDQVFQKKRMDFMGKMMNQIGNRGPGRHNQITLAAALRELGTQDSTWNQSKPARGSHPAETEGSFQQVRYAMQSLLKLSWERDQLRLDREHWDVAFAGKTTQEIGIDVDHLLQTEGVDPSPPDADRRILRGRNGNQTSNAERLFQQLKNGSSSMSSRSGGFGVGGANQNFRVSFENQELAARLTMAGSDFELHLEERSDSARLLICKDKQQRGLQLTLLGEDIVFRFAQQPTGAVQLVEISDHETLKLQAASFAKLYRDHTRVIEERFFPLLDHLGIVPPRSRFDDEIVIRLLQKLSFDQNASQAEAATLIKQLDVDKFTKREAAFKSLRDNLDEYYDAIYESSDDPAFSREARVRIKKLLQSKQQHKLMLDRAIASMGLLDNTEYLSELRDIVSPANVELIDRQLSILDVLGVAPSNE